MTGEGAAREGGATHNSITGGIFFHAVIQGRDITVQLPSAIKPALSGLPKPASAFTGRDQHVERLLKDLAPATEGAGEQRTVLVSAVSGLAGIGKTELAVQTAAQALRQPGWFPGGVLFVDLFGYDPGRTLSPERALEGLLHALGVPGEHIPGGLEDRQRLYRSVLAAYAGEGRRILVVVDNASTTGQAGPLLPTDGITAALVTSRHTLDGLDARLHDLDTLDSAASLAVLDQALRHARGDGDTRFTDDAESAAVIAQLCAGLPLALRIAAAVLAASPGRPASDLAAALQAEHGRLDKLARPDRAVRAAFDLSYEHLTPGQARIFRLLPLNPGPDLATESAAHLADTGSDQAGELLQQLAEAHLIEPGSSWGRWRMHDLVRLYADEHGRTHATPDQRDTARTRLFTHYQDTTEAADTHLETRPGPRAPRFPDRSRALQWLDAEHTNLIATATAAPDFGQSAITTSLASSLADYLEYRRYFDDWITLTTTALAIYRDRGDRRNEGMALNNLANALQDVRRFEEAIDAYSQDLAICRELDDRLSEAQTSSNLGTALQQVRRFEEAINAHTQAATICRDLDDRHGEAQALASLGTAFQQVRRLEESIDAQTRAVTIFRDLDDRHNEGMTLINLGNVLREVRRFEEAIDTLGQAITIFRDRDDQHREGLALTNLGNALWGVRRFEEAIDAQTQAVTIFRNFEDRHSESLALMNLGNTLSTVRRFEEAVDAQTEAVTIFRDLDDRHNESQTLINLGNTQRELRQFEKAIDTQTQASAICRELGNRHGEGMALTNLGNTLWAVWQLEEAIDAQNQAVTIFHDLGDRHNEGMALTNLGNALWMVEQFEEAIDAQNQAVTIFRDLDDRHNESQALTNLGNALWAVRRFEEATNAQNQATAICRELENRHGEGMALTNLGNALRGLQRYEEAIDAYTQAVTTFRDFDDRHNEELAQTGWAIAHNELWLRRG